jgi:glycosyltransferase involved in cell wall biosynthesis
MHALSLIQQTRAQVGRRYRQVRDIWVDEGPHGVTDRIRAAAASLLAPRGAIFPVVPADVLAADLSQPFQFVIPKVSPGQRIVVNWVMGPPAPGSGGHTTLFRIIRYLQAHGYENRIYFYNVFRGDLGYYETIVRDYYKFEGPVASVDKGMQDAHAVMATYWATAYPVFNSRCAGKRFYLVQDFEPYFHPVGTLSVLAENTYRMGFHAITIGRCFAEKLRTEFGMEVDSFNYGCDFSRYRRQNAKRAGIVFYARSDTARRGFELGMMALQLFAARRPDVKIHIYGDKLGTLPFAFVDHGRVTPDQLNDIYNQCYAGLSLSFTNVSLVALEMLAAGCIPVVNDSPLIRTDLDNNPFVRYASAYPHALAAEMEAVVNTEDFDSLSGAAAASVRSATWDDAGATVDAILRKALAAWPDSPELTALNSSSMGRNLISS